MFLAVALLSLFLHGLPGPRGVTHPECNIHKTHAYRVQVLVVIFDMPEGGLAILFHGNCCKYDPYGKVTILAPDGVTVRATSSIGNEITYTGRRRDAETGLYYFRNRYYSGDLGRFINRDPLEYPDGMNMYMGYFSVNGWDPLGLADRLPRGDGHHIIPWSIFGSDCSSIPLRVAEFWNSIDARILVPSGDHDFTAHGEYNIRVKILWKKFLDEKKVCQSKVTLEMAKEFLERVKNIDDEYLKGYLNNVAKGKSAILRWYSKRGRAVRAQGRLFRAGKYFKNAAGFLVEHLDDGIKGVGVALTFIDILYPPNVNAGEDDLLNPNNQWKYNGDLYSHLEDDGTLWTYDEETDTILRFPPPITQDEFFKNVFRGCKKDEKDCCDKK